MKDENGNIDCNGLQNCKGCINCDNSTWCNNSTRCNNSAYLLYCDDLVLEKYCVFNKKVSEKRFKEIKELLENTLPYYLHPKNLTKENKAWIKKYIKEYNESVLNKVIENSILPDNPKKKT